MKSDKGKLDMQTLEKKDGVQVFSTDDSRLKLLGEVFSNESSRKILSLLLEKESTIMEISKECEISVNLTIHHLKKMVDSGIVVITKETTNSRGRPLRFYRAKPAIVILPPEAAARASKSKSLQKTLGKIIRFGSIGLVGMFTWVFTSSTHSLLETALKYPRPTLPPYMTPIEPQSSGDLVFATVITASVVVAGILINHIFKRIRR
jgi:vacuolar-type H+-ATPase subunit F/Vma7